MWCLWDGKAEQFKLVGRNKSWIYFANKWKKNVIAGLGFVGCCCWFGFGFFSWFGFFFPHLSSPAQSSQTMHKQNLPKRENSCFGKVMPTPADWKQLPLCRSDTLVKTRFSFFRSLGCFLLLWNLWAFWKLKPCCCFHEYFSILCFSGIRILRELTCLVSSLAIFESQRIKPPENWQYLRIISFILVTGCGKGGGITPALMLKAPSVRKWLVKSFGPCLK